MPRCNARRLVSTNLLIARGKTSLTEVAVLENHGFMQALIALPQCLQTRYCCHFGTSLGDGCVVTLEGGQSTSHWCTLPRVRLPASWRQSACCSPAMAALSSRPGSGRPVAELLRKFPPQRGISPTTFYALVKEGELSLIKIGRRSFVQAEELDDFLRRKRYDAASRT
jgi:hypothetical protein